MNHLQKQKKYKIIIINKTSAFSHHFWRALSSQLGTGVVFAGALQKSKTKEKNRIDDVKVNYNHWFEFLYLLTVTVLCFSHYVNLHREHNCHQFHMKTSNSEVSLRTVDDENQHFQTQQIQICQIKTPFTPNWVKYYLARSFYTKVDEL